MPIKPQSAYIAAKHADRIGMLHTCAGIRRMIAAAGREYDQLFAAREELDTNLTMDGAEFRATMDMLRTRCVGLVRSIAILDAAARIAAERHINITAEQVRHLRRIAARRAA